jgi:hypothetical protein
MDACDMIVISIAIQYIKMDMRRNRQPIELAIDAAWILM